METAQTVVESIQARVKDWLAGKMDKNTFDDFIKTSDAKLTALKAKQERSAEFWRNYWATCYY
jgi:hypothetical protein